MRALGRLLFGEPLVDAEEDPEGNWLMELRASTAGDPSSPGMPGAPDIAAAEAALFDPHDIRQTAARFRWPVQRQQWVVTDDGGTTRRHNSADAQKRGVPPYLLIMDLVFAAIFTATSQVMYLGHGGVALFFALFLPQMWLWMLTNYRYNGFDAEDISFELVNVLLMVGVMGLATNLKGCFCSLMTREDSWFLSYSNSSSTFTPVYSQMVDERCEGANEVEHVEGEVCALFFVTYAGVRLLLGALSLYVAYHVRRARALLWRELLVLIILVPLLFAIFVELGSDATSVTVVLWLAAMLIDVLLDVGCHVWLACTPASCEPVARALMLRVPMNIAYAEARYERMFVIAVGNVVANAIADSGHERFRTKWGAKTQLVIGVPWVALLLKLFYFDLSPHHGGTFFSVGNTIANVSGIIAPAVARRILDMDNRSRQAWQLIFYISGAMYLGAAALFARGPPLMTRHTVGTAAASASSAPSVDFFTSRVTAFAARATRSSRSIRIERPAFAPEPVSLFRPYVMTYMKASSSASTTSSTLNMLPVTNVSVE